MTETATKTVRLEVHNNDEWAEAPEVFQVEVAPEWAREWLARIALCRKLKAADPHVMGVEYWSNEGEFYSRDWDRHGADDEPFPTGEPHRTEYDRMHVREDSLWWTSDLKHTSIEVFTDPLPLSELEAIAGVRRCGKCGEVIDEPSHPEIPGQWDEPVQGPRGAWYHRACAVVFP